MENNKHWNWEDIKKTVIFEDEAILAINKPPGIAVVGATGETDIVTLAKSAGETILPVHRIDKVTSGLVLFAKHITIHAQLTRQFHKRTVDKEYLATVNGTGLPDRGEIQLPLSIGRKNTVRVAAKRENIVFDEKTNVWSVSEDHLFSNGKYYPSATQFMKLFEDDKRTLLAVKPITGRRHQIRVHLAWIGYPIAGDPLFARDQEERTYLHSWKLVFNASWIGDQRRELEAVPDDNFWETLSKAFNKKKIPVKNPLRIFARE